MITQKQQKSILSQLCRPGVKHKRTGKPAPLHEASGEIPLLASSGFWCRSAFVLADYSSLAFFFFFVPHIFSSLYFLLFVLLLFCLNLPLPFSFMALVIGYKP